MLSSIFGGRRAPTEFEVFMRPCFDGLYARAYTLTGNAQDAEDLVQELCIRVHSRFDEVTGLDNPNAWMMRVLYRLFVDLVRSRHRSPIRAMSASEADGFSDSVASEAPGPEQSVEAMIAEERLQRAWEYLTHDDQMLLTLHGIEGLSLAEIKEITGFPIGTIKSRLHRSRVRLGRLLERETKLAALKSRGPDDELPRHRKALG